jgi:hypothetical protein
LDSLPQCKFDFFYDHRDNKKRTLCQALPGAFFLFWQKEAKTMGRNNHPADSLDRRPGKGGKACGRDASPNKGKKAKQA